MAVIVSGFGAEFEHRVRDREAPGLGGESREAGSVSDKEEQVSEIVGSDHGFRRRMRTTSGQAVLKRRRAKGRKVLCTKSYPRTGKGS